MLGDAALGHATARWLPAAAGPGQPVGRPNSPSPAPPRNASHSARVKIRAGPSECRELRMATSPAGRKATSTQFPPVGPLRRLLTHVTPASALAGMPLLMMLMGIPPYPRACPE